MSLGIVVGYIFLSLIIKALDRLRGNRQDKLRSMEDEICQLKTELATTRARIQSLVQQGKRDTSIIGVRDNKIINQSTEIMSLKASVTRLNPFEIEANDLRPQIGLLRDEIRDKTRTIKTLRDELEKTERNLTVSNERFEFVNQNAARALETERNLRAFLGERDEAARRIGEEHREAIKNLKGEHSVTIENLKEKHDEELEMMREEHGEEIEAVRKRANEELDGIILTKNRELALLKREREPISPINDNNVSPNQR
jgi:chromosome segregation ATPase